MTRSHGGTGSGYGYHLRPSPLAMAMAVATFIAMAIAKGTDMTVTHSMDMATAIGMSIGSPDPRVGGHPKEFSHEKEGYQLTREGVAFSHEVHLKRQCTIPPSYGPLLI